MCTQKDNTTVKIIDFGTAKELEPGTAIKVLCGTPEFVAPEVIPVETCNIDKVAPELIFVQIARLIESVFVKQLHDDISQVVRYDFISTGSGEQ